MMDKFGIKDMMSIANDPNGIENLLLEPHEDTGIPPAAIFADVFNILRLDQARIAREVGVELDVERMSPERAAELMADLASPGGSQGALVEAFNAEAEQRDKILRAMLDGDEYETFMGHKIGALHTQADRPDSRE